MSSIEELKNKGNEAFKARNFDKAIEFYTSAIEINSESEDAALCYSNRAAAYQSKKMWSKAENDAAQCVKLKPGFVKGWLRLATAQQKQGMLVESRQTLEKGLELHKDDLSLKKALDKATARCEKENQRKTISAMATQAVNAEVTKLSKEKERLRTQLMQCMGQIGQIERDLRINQIAKQEVKKLSEDTNTYRSVGKMFLYSTKKETETWIDQCDKDEAAQLKSLQTQKKYLEGKIDNITKNIMEQMKVLRGF
eukprot:g2624.t1